MDPLSMTASIIAVATLAFSVAKGLAQIEHPKRSTDQELLQFSTEVRSLADLFKMVGVAVSNSTGRHLEDRSLFADLLHICNRVLEPLNKLQKSLNTFNARFRDDRSKLTHLGVIIRWQFRTKDKLIVYREVLRWNHSVLDTLLQLVMFQSQSRTLERLESLRLDTALESGHVLVALTVT
jgi:hypothetical protein